MSQPTSFYEAVGGEETFRRLVHRFYQGVAEDPVLRPVYPAKDLGPAEEHLRLFLIQYWGGPRTYDELRGHPRLRMRHARFAIGEAERDAWLRQMRVALDELELDPALDAQLWEYLVMAAHSLVNVEPAHGRGDLGLTPALGLRSGGAVVRRRVEPEALESAQHGVRLPFRLGRDPHAREQREELSQRNCCLQPGERGAEAEVDAVAERQVAMIVAAHIEAVGVGEHCLVAVGRAEQQQDERSGADRGPGDLRVAQRIAGQKLDRRVVAEQLLHRLPDELGILSKDG